LEFLEKHFNHYDLKGGGCRNDIWEVTCWPAQKIVWLKWLNSKKLMKETLRFSKNDISKENFTKWLHKVFGM